MCKAMNRSFFSVILGGFGAAEGATAAAPNRSVRSGSPDDVAFLLGNAESVIIVPDTGSPVARAQHAVKEMAQKLIAKGRQRPLRDPSRGRPHARAHERAARRSRSPVRPGLRDGGHQQRLRHHRHRLRPRRQRRREPAGRGERQPDLRHADPRSHKARTCLVNKRSMASGYAGIDNPLFYMDKTMMVFGDAKKVVEDIVKAIE
jgi:NAD(P) transhydrogenase subunit beta